MSLASNVLGPNYVHWFAQEFQNKSAPCTDRCRVFTLKNSARAAWREQNLTTASKQRHPAVTRVIVLPE